MACADQVVAMANAEKLGTASTPMRQENHHQ
jgi:hypothetical protein